MPHNAQPHKNPHTFGDHGHLNHGHPLAIQNIIAREILDSRGFPTVEVEVVLANGVMNRAAVPSGASTGKFEALELRDGDNHRFMGKGVRHVVETIESDIFQILQGRRVDEQRKIDTLLIELDGTENKSNLGANAMLAVSLACAKTAARAHKMPLFRYLGGVHSHILPMPLINIINGGAHANNGLDIQEFMIVPVAATTIMEALELSGAVFHTLKGILKKRGISVAVGDEGGVAPKLDNTRAALDLIMEAITTAGLTPGEHMALALDVAASEFFDESKGHYQFEGKSRSSADMINFYEELVQNYPILSIEDPLDQEDFAGYAAMTKQMGHRLQIVGDDLFVTNPKRLKQGIAQHATNAILIKLNQIGTLSETLDVIEMAHKAGMKTVISHRSGETEDTTIADLAVAVNAGQIKTGSLCRSERTAKYNQLLRIEEKLGREARFAKDIFQTR